MVLQTNRQQIKNKLTRKILLEISSWKKPNSIINIYLELSIIGDQIKYLRTDCH